MAIIDFFDRGWKMGGTAVAYVQDDREFTFDEVGALSCRIANTLISLGLPAETKGAIWSANDVVAWSCALGLWRANMTWIPVNPRNAAEDNRVLLDDFDCEILFFQQAFAETVLALRPTLPKIKHWICIDQAMADVPMLLDWCAHQASIKPDIIAEPDDVFIIMPTGGTTGRPKGVMNTNRAIQTCLAHFFMAFTYRDGTKPVNLAAAPMTHTSGLMSLPCTAQGGKVVVLTKPEPRLLIEAIMAHRVTELFLPPTVIYSLLETPGIEEADFSSLRYLIYGAAPMSVEKLKKAIDLWGPVLCETYGQCEAMGSISNLRPDEHLDGGRLAADERLSSVGRPNPLVRVEIMDEQNTILKQGETGEICVRGDLIMKGYYKAPEKTAETIIDGWLHTGDIGHIDVDGYLHITDRKKDMIISGGFNVYPSAVEQVIWSHPAVQDCAVIGVPDPKWGEAVKAVVQCNAGMRVDAEEIIALCKARLGGVMAPKSVDFLDQLPRSPVGKVLKKDLRETYWRNQSKKI